MNFTRLCSRSQTRELMDKFLGYDRRLSAPEGSFCEMQNLSSDQFPMLSPRKMRRTILELPGEHTRFSLAPPVMADSVTGMVSVEGEIYFCMGVYLYPGLDQLGIDMGLTEEPKQMIRMGAYVLIFPDRKYINTTDHEDRGDIDAVFTAADQTRIHICRPDGRDYTAEYISDTEPDSPKDKGVWVNTSEYPNTLRQWNETAKCWTQVTTSCVKLHCMGISSQFKIGDGVTISGIKGNSSIKDFRTGEPLSEKQLEQLESLEGAAVIRDLKKSFGDEYIVIEGIMDAECTIASALTISRKMPTMDFVAEHGNRLWGCRYGQDDAGEMVNTLYASKLGDFRNWTAYQGIDTDSYYANVGTDGPFTGAISWGYGDRVLFFKEHGVHTVSGDGPSSFRVEWIGCDGVQNGSGKSLCELDGIVYYKSVHGVCAFSGGTPQEIGEVFGGTSYQKAVGGRWQHKYYIGMEDADGDTHLFVYDPRLKLWHREDDFRVSEIVDGGTELYLLSDAGSLHTVRGSAGTREQNVKWMAQTGKLGTDHPDRKYLTRINVRLRLDRGARFRLFIRYDSSGTWVQLCNVLGTALRAYDVPVRIRRCDHYELRLEGEGPGEVYSIVKTYQTGSDRR